MRDSAECIQFIADYLSSYKTKIESLNKNGLFDSATLYELFASEVCKLWFGQDFKNLNTVRANYPYVDLVSEDGTIFVQVSTGQDIPGKVKSTLEKIRNSEDPSFSKIRILYFFVLGNDSIKDVPEYKNETRIGAIDFSPVEHLISIDSIISKAKSDLGFQKSLYDLLLYESESFRATAEKLDAEIRSCRGILNSDISGLINGEYEIDKDELIARIRSEDCRYISIIGDAGLGKSALCKKLVSDESVILFTRAEKIAEVTDIDQIWGLSVSKLLRYLNGKRIVFYIDALEFVADGRKTNIDLLQRLYEITRDFNNAHIFTSCRTSDKNAFLRLTSAYEIQEYSVPELTDSEISQVARKYPIISVLRQQNRYSQLLKSPFYLNMIVEQLKSADDLSGTNGLRGYIWDNVICLKDKTLPAGITSDEIRDAVNKIVFTRAKEFSIGIPKDDIPDHILKVLISYGVVLQTKGNLRLTYDIFEDICFEQRFDREFEKCKGDYCAFFASLTDLGRCVYRRYQIWVENKLFIKEGRESFLYSLVFSDNLPDNWKKQTIIGIIKSRFCKDFFYDYGPDLIEKNYITEFFEITNLYSFETHVVKMSNGNNYAVLRPVGVGREQLIQMAKENKLNEEPRFKREIIKMCMDYARSLSFDTLTANAACGILETYVDQLYQKAVSLSSYSIGEEALNYLRSLYLMAEFCADWLRQFWKKELNEYRAYSRSVNNRLAEDVLEHVFKNTTPVLADVMLEELAELAWVYWVEQPERKDDPYQLYSSHLGNEEYYGLNENASHYSYAFKSVKENTFLHYVALTQLERALRWTIKLTNYAADSLQRNMPDEVYKVELINFSQQKKYTYLAHHSFSFVGIQEYNVPTLIGDSVYNIRQVVFQHIEHHLLIGNNEYCARFVDWIKRIILEESNNTILLELIEDIGLIYAAQFPGYSIIFASSINYIMIDTQRELAQSGYRSFMQTRYQDKAQPIYSLKKYISEMQLIGRAEDKELCNMTLDYLYSIVPNDKENAVQHLQIQKMDLRRARVVSYGKELYLYPQITGAAQKVTENYEKSKSYEEQNVIARLEQQYKEAGSGCNLPLKDCLTGIKELEEILLFSNNALFAEGTYIKYISCALRKAELDKEKRSAYCIFWINGLNRINSNGSFVYDTELTHILYEQAGRDLTEEAQEALKRLFLTILINKNQNGLISSLKTSLSQYLSSNEHWATLLFNTLLMLAKDEMTHNLHNANYAKLYFGKEISEYQPNLSLSLSRVDYHITKRRGTLYQSQEKEIIQKYLLNEERIALTDFNINEYDISTLCHLTNCGIPVTNIEIYGVIKAMLHQMIEIWFASSQNNTHSNVLDTFDEGEISTYLKFELINPESTDLVIDLMFSGIDYSKFVSDTYEFYEEVLIGYLPQYVDAYNNTSNRRRYKGIAEKIEAHILRVPDEKVQIQLYRVLFLPSPRFYCGDWSNCRTAYSYFDKQFINSLWEKYGQYRLSALITAIYELHIGELLPEALLAINNSFKKACEDGTDSVETTIAQNRERINRIITTSFVTKEDQIKQSIQLTAAFESFLELLIDFNVEVAAVLLDEFRIH